MLHLLSQRRQFGCLLLVQFICYNSINAYILERCNRSSRKHPDWKHHKHHVIKTTQNNNGTPSTEHQLYQWSEMSAQSCKDMKRHQPQSVHAAAFWQKIQKYPPLLDYGSASFLRLWNSWTHSQQLTIQFFFSFFLCCLKRDYNLHFSVQPWLWNDNWMNTETWI